MKQTFPGRWIGREDSVPWPPGSLNVTPLDIFFWRFVKDYVCKVKI